MLLLRWSICIISAVVLTDIVCSAADAHWQRIGITVCFAICTVIHLCFLPRIRVNQFSRIRIDDIRRLFILCFALTLLSFLFSLLDRKSVV